MGFWTRYGGDDSERDDWLRAFVAAAECNAGGDEEDAVFDLDLEVRDEEGWHALGHTSTLFEENP